MTEDKSEVGPTRQGAAQTLSCLWVQPNPRTMEFSEKKHSEMFKTYKHFDSVKLDEIGHTFQHEILTAVKEAAEAITSQTAASGKSFESGQGISLENEVFLRRMAALVSTLPAWSTQDPKTRMAKLDWMKIDLLYITDLQNLFSEYLQHYVSMLQRGQKEYLSAVDGGPDGP